MFHVCEHNEERGGLMLDTNVDFVTSSLPKASVCAMSPDDGTQCN